MWLGAQGQGEEHGDFTLVELEGGVEEDCLVGRCCCWSSSTSSSSSFLLCCDSGGVVEELVIEVGVVLVTGADQREDDGKSSTVVPFNIESMDMRDIVACCTVLGEFSVGVWGGVLLCSSERKVAATESPPRKFSNLPPSNSNCDFPW